MLRHRWCIVALLLLTLLVSVHVRPCAAAAGAAAIPLTKGGGHATGVPGVVSASSAAAAATDHRPPTTDHLCTAAAAAPTNLILLTLGDYSINPLTLGLSWRDAAFEEHAQRTRTVLRIARGDVSLCIWRLLFLQTLHFDELAFDGIQLFLLQDEAGRLAPFYTPAMTNATLIVALAGATNRYTRGDANRTRMRKAAELHGVSLEDRAPTAVVVPDLLVTNATIICRARDTGAHLWSLSNAYLAVHDFSAPVLDNDEPWQVHCGAEIGGAPRRRLDISARFLSQTEQPLLELCLTGTQVRLTGLWHSLARTKRRTAPAAPDQPPATNWFARCFSNEWRGFWQAFERERTRLRDLPIVSNYLARGALDSMLCDVSFHLVISNRTYQPGHVTLTFTRPAPRPDVLRIAYRITNSPAVFEYLGSGIELQLNAPLSRAAAAASAPADCSRRASHGETQGAREQSVGGSAGRARRAWRGGN